MDSILDWGTDYTLQLALISTHLKDHEIDDVAQVVTQSEGPDRSSPKGTFLKEERIRCFKNGDFKVHTDLGFLSLCC